MKMILFVLNDPAKMQDLLNAWKEAGATGATVLFSTGMGRLHQSAGLRDDLPLMPSLSDFYDSGQELSRTLFTIVKDDETVTNIIAATCAVVGDLDQPDTGLLITLPVEHAEGLEKKDSRKSQILQ
jgi:nitrogen regulatory protein PII